MARRASLRLSTTIIVTLVPGPGAGGGATCHWHDPIQVILCHGDRLGLSDSPGLGLMPRQTVTAAARGI